MVSIRFTSFLFVCFLFHVIVRAHSHQTMKKIVALYGEAGTAVGGANKEINVGVHAAADEIKNRMLSGRKMMSNKELVGRDGAKNEIVNHQAVEVSGACNPNNVKCKRNKGIHHPKNDVFEAFSADYYVPRSHPPKNN